MINCNADERCRRQLDGGDPLSAHCADANQSLLLRQKKTYALIQSIGLFQRNKSLAGFVKYASRVKYCFAM